MNMQPSILLPVTLARWDPRDEAVISKRGRWKDKQKVRELRAAFDLFDADKR